MTHRPFVLPLLILVVLFFGGCAHQDIGVWRASDLENHAASTIRLEHQGQPVGYINRDKVKLVMEVKNRIQGVVPGVDADLLIATPKEPNAFASTHDGRPVVGITLGMLDLVGLDRDAYAALLGHEFAHLSLHHGETRAKRGAASFAVSEILGLVMSQVVPMGGTLTSLAVTAIERTYTRDEERAADKTGFEYLVSAGFDSAGAIRLWEKMHAASSGLTIPFLATHPMSQERIDAMKALASTAPPKKEVPSPPTVSRSEAVQPTTGSSSSIEDSETTFRANVDRRIAIGQVIRVSMEPLGLYGDPSLRSQRMGRIYKTDALTVEEIADEWLKVRSNSGYGGWILRSWVSNNE
jgi:hypothetical protein